MVMILNMSKHSLIPHQRGAKPMALSLEHGWVCESLVMTEWKWSCCDYQGEVWKGNEVSVFLPEHSLLQCWFPWSCCALREPETKPHLSHQWPPVLWMRVLPEGSTPSQQALPSWSSRNWNADELILQCLVQIPNPESMRKEKWLV